MPPVIRTCPRGHRYQPPPPAEGLAPGVPLACPVCGVRVEGLAEEGRSATVSAPPLPEVRAPGASPGEAPTLGGVCVRCPHCQNPIHLGDAHSDEVLCP